MPKTDHRVLLTDNKLKGLKKAPKGTRYQIMDQRVPGFGVRVTDTGAASFILRTRFPAGGKSASRRELGRVGVMSLADAREKANAWLRLIEKEIDPAVEEERQRTAARVKMANTFSAAAEDFIKEKLPGERKGKEIEQDIRRDLIPAWGALPIADITEGHVLTVVKAKKRAGRGAGAAARNLFALVKRFFRWAIAQRVYGLEKSPCDGIQIGLVLGDIGKRQGRSLSDLELFAYWRAAKRMPYPFGPAYRLLALSALRLNEAARASRPEFNFAEDVWVIPAERMKGKNAGKKQARAHEVPITAEIRELVDGLPKFKKGKYLFSTTAGEKPCHIGSKVKAELDRRMLSTLRALARKRGETPADVKWRHFVNHDVRHTIRSHLSTLKVAEEVREAVLAHVRPGIKGVYDHHEYFDEKKEALQLWATRLKSIVEPPTGDNVVSLASARSA